MKAELAAQSIQEIVPGVFRWEIFSPNHKVELTSHAIVTGGKIFCFDPIPLADEPFRQLSHHGQPIAIVLTNENHERDSLAWRKRWQVPIWAAADAILSIPEVQRFSPGQLEWKGLHLHSMSGGAGGEIAFRLAGQSLVVFGDSVVNLPSRQLELLPAKYCRNPAELRHNLALLLAEPFDCMVMAHGTPILREASRRLAELLASPKL
jgi:hypothetical protein